MCIRDRAKAIRKEYNIKNLCLAGGVALNCVANGKLLRSGVFENIFIQPAAGDAGGALGAALSVYYLYNSGERKIGHIGDSMKGSYLGPSFTNEDIENQLINCGAKFIKLDEDKL